jgi:hypothetical protein
MANHFCNHTDLKAAASKSMHSSDFWVIKTIVMNSICVDGNKLLYLQTEFWVLCNWCFSAQVQGQVAGSCECGNEPPGSIKCGEFLD